MDIVKRLDEMITKGEDVLKTHSPNPPNVIGFPTLDGPMFAAWKTQTIAFLESFLPKENAYLREFIKSIESAYLGTAARGIDLLKSIKEDYEKGYITINNLKALDNPFDNLVLILDRFHLVARQLRSRYKDRDTLDINDEYDVQDLLHALLRIYFDDIRPEEWTPSYAGSCARMDFLLKNEGIVIEVKKTRKGLTVKEIGNQLIEDIARYESHSDCLTLVCFVYDPEGLIGNPKSLENDLRRDGELTVRVLVKP